MHTIPPLAWTAIAFVVIFILVLNFILFAFLRGPVRPRQMKMPRSQQTIEDLRKMGAVLRDPFMEERSQLGELSRRVEQLKEPPGDQNQEKQGE